MLRSVTFALAALAFLTSGPARADAPATRPAIPALIVGTPPPRSFIVNGIFRFSSAGGLAFHVATDGKRQICALYDPSDGTPLFLSDGQQTLVYDLANSRVVRVPVSRGTIRVDWDAQKPKPLSFSFAVDFKSKPERLDESNAWFRVDRFVDSATTLKLSGKQGNSELFVAERNGGSVESLEIPPDNKWFRFTSMSRGKSFYALELNATNIDDQLPDAALAFPDPKRLPQDVRLTDLDQQTLPTFLVFLRDGRAWMAKMALAAGAEMRGPAEKSMPNADWGELRKRDVSFGAAYRKALAEQGVELRTYPKAATTQSTR